MRKITLLFVFLGFYSHFLPAFGQDTLLSAPPFTPRLDWQEQILQQVDIEELGESAYEELLEELSEMVLWSDTARLSARHWKVRQQLIVSTNRTLNHQAGYDSSLAEGKGYRGDPWHQGLRYRVKAGGHWQAGLSLEKDAGEPWRSQVPFYDGWHAFLAYQRDDGHGSAPAWLRQGVVGHYRLHMGCGLLINQGFSLGKQYVARQFSQRTNSFSPLASMAESDYMQGIALQLQWGRHLTLLPYFSALQLDGTLKTQSVTQTDGSIQSQPLLTSIKTDGLHRTTQEEQSRNAVWQSIFGLRAGWRGEWYDLGLHLMTTQMQCDYSRPLLYYNKHTFRGRQLTQASADYRLQAYGFTLRGELAFDHQGGMASLNLLRRRLGPYWQASLIHRYYSPHYLQLHASSLRESSSMQGEQGLTMGLDGELSKRWRLELMADVFHFSQPQYGLRDSTSQGVEALARATYTYHEATLVLGYRLKQKGDYMRHSFDSYLTFSPVNQLSLRTQLRARLYAQRATQQGSLAYYAPSVGWLIAQAATWQSSWRPAPFSLTAQATYFKTDDYDSRLYLTERSVLYGFSLPMLYGQGMRYSINGNLHLGTHLIAELKWAMTNYAHRNTLGSGLQQIEGNTQQDLWLQLRVKW